MKKPKFNQLRGTPAQPLRHRICLGITLASSVVMFACTFGLNKLAPESLEKYEPYLQILKMNPIKKTPTFDVRIEPPPQN